MTTLIIIATVVVLGILILTRLPKVLNSERHVDLISVGSLCLIVVMLLAIDDVYQVVDSRLGARNFANLVSHLLLYVVFWVVGIQISSALRLSKARKLITGSVNLIVSGVVVGLTIALFLASDLPHSSMGLLDYNEQMTVQLYLVLGRLYPAVVAALLLGPASWTTVASVPLTLLRISSFMTLIGLCLVVPSPIFEALRPYRAWATPIEDSLVFGAAILVALGSILTWVSRKAEVRPATDFKP